MTLHRVHPSTLVSIATLPARWMRSDTPTAYWKHPLDLEMVVALIKFIHKLYRTKPFSDFVKKRVIPEEGVEDDESLRDFAKNTLGSAYHPLGTAAMLPREDGGVVDGELRVYGTKNLRVVRLLTEPRQSYAHINSMIRWISLWYRW